MNFNRPVFPADDSGRWQHAGTRDRRGAPAAADDTSGLYDATAVDRAALAAAQHRVPPGGTGCECTTSSCYLPPPPPPEPFP